MEEAVKQNEAVMCKEHGRLIVAVIDVDDDNEKKYCIGCIEALEAELAVTKQALEGAAEEAFEVPDCDNCDERRGDEPTHNEGRD